MTQAMQFEEMHTAVVEKSTDIVGEDEACIPRPKRLGHHVHINRRKSDACFWQMFPPFSRHSTEAPLPSVSAANKLWSQCEEEQIRRREKGGRARDALFGTEHLNHAGMLDPGLRDCQKFGSKNNNSRDCRFS